MEVRKAELEELASSLVTVESQANLGRVTGTAN